MKTKIILVVVLCVVLVFASAFFVINFDALFPNSIVEQIQPDKPDNVETPDNSNGSGGNDNTVDNEENNETPIQPGGELTITIDKSTILF